ncbi:Hypothetical_protein [Hexamita inflata]|uniref:Hypothetical_protein n=1 Tax=Hexamita inflata TaxID=28002 RepID=A0AA86UPF8_9EUKA|nr:Hypothetical protein HINF_LOCUS46921 [Hexamita inflata]
MKIFANSRRMEQFVQNISSNTQSMSAKVRQQPAFSRFSIFKPSNIQHEFILSSRIDQIQPQQDQQPKLNLSLPNNVTILKLQPRAKHPHVSDDIFYNVENIDMCPIYCSVSRDELIQRSDYSTVISLIRLKTYFVNENNEANISDIDFTQFQFALQLHWPELKLKFCVQNIGAKSSVHRVEIIQKEFGVKTKGIIVNGTKKVSQFLQEQDYDRIESIWGSMGRTIQ